MCPCRTLIYKKKKKESKLKIATDLNEHNFRLFTGKGGKNRRRGKNENESEKRELVFKEDGQGELTWAWVE